MNVWIPCLLLKLIFLAFDDKLLFVSFQEDKQKAYRREKRKEKKRKHKEEEEDVDNDMAAIMGFGGFGGSSKNNWENITFWVV